MKKLTNLQLRLIFGIVITLFLFFILLYSNNGPYRYLFLSVILFFQGMTLWEAFNLFKAKGIIPHTHIGLLFSLLATTCYFILHTSTLLPFASHLLILSFILITFVANFRNIKGALSSISATLATPIFITYPFILLIDISLFTTLHNAYWAFYLLTTSKMTDICAYFIGKAFGRRKLTIVSPKKTQEGAIGGLVGSVITSILLGLCLNLDATINLAYLGVGIGVLSQIGDIAESLLKRDADKKDSGSLPGFGGFFDMVDALLFVTPFLYIYLMYKDMLLV